MNDTTQIKKSDTNPSISAFFISRVGVGGTSSNFEVDFSQPHPTSIFLSPPWGENYLAWPMKIWALI